MYQPHLQFLSQRAISPAMAAAAGLESHTSASAAAELFGDGSDKTLPGDAIKIPYSNLDGDLTIGDDGVPFTRFRVLDTRDLPEGQKAFRYSSRAGSGSRPYVPPMLADALAKSATGFVVITEGEFKSIAATCHGLPTIGLAGVTMWADGPKGSLNERSPVHPDILESVKRAGCGIVLADSDATGNTNVSKPMRLLARAITAQTGLPCAYCVVPGHKVGKKTFKMGLDDWIAQQGHIDSIETFLLGHKERETKRHQILTSGGYVPLGYLGDKNAVWSVERGALFLLNSSTITSPGTLINLAGGLAWCEAAYGSYRGGDEGGLSSSVSVDWIKMGGELVERCLSAGPFEQSSVRGAGVWLDAGRIVINDGDGVWAACDGAPVERTGGEYIYPAPRRLGIRPEVVPATAADALQVLDAFQTWKWVRKSDAYLMMGWVCLSFLAGALKWRPHISLTGPAGTGKSTIMRFITDIFGRAGANYDADSSEPGIRQFVKNDAIALLLDEAEADGVKLASLLTFLRSASDDKIRVMGTQDQTGISYSMRVTGMVTGIVPPALNAADTTRFLRLELTARDKEADKNPHALVAESDAAKKAGLRLWRRMITSWDRFQRAQVPLRKALTGTDRYRDGLAPILAALFVSLNDSELDDVGAERLVSMIDLSEMSAAISDAKDESDVLDHLMGSTLELDLPSGRQKTTSAEAFAHCLEELLDNPRGGEYSKALGRHGMKVVKSGQEEGRGVLLVAAKSPGFMSIFRGTKWAKGDLGAVFKRVPGAERKVLEETVRIGGQSVRPLAIHLPEMERPIIRQRPSYAQGPDQYEHP